MKLKRLKIPISTSSCSIH